MDEPSSLDASCQSANALASSTSYTSLTSLDSVSSEPSVARLTLDELQAVDMFYRKVLVVGCFEKPALR